MDPGAALCRSRRLASLFPSRFPPPLGERTRQSRCTHSHFDSHTMGDHEPKISEILDIPPHIWEVEPSSTYGTLIRSSHSMLGKSLNDPS